MAQDRVVWAPVWDVRANGLPEDLPLAQPLAPADWRSAETVSCTSCTSRSAVCRHRPQRIGLPSWA